MNKLFEVVFLDQAFVFLQNLDQKHAEKILYNIRKAQVGHDPELFKKLNGEIWEFRTRYQGLQYRFLAFWDKNNAKTTLVVTTHGLIKKQSKMPQNELKKAELLRVKYFQEQFKINKK